MEIIVNYNNSKKSSKPLSLKGLEFVIEFLLHNLGSNQQLMIHTANHLNSSLLIDSAFQFNNTKDSSYDLYIYNANNELIQDKNYAYSSKGSTLSRYTNFTIYNGNNMQEVETIITGSTTSTTTINYSYYNYTNSIFLGLSYIHNANLTKSKIKSYSNSSDKDTVNYTYTFDNSNRVASQIQNTNSNGGATVTDNYSYY